MRDAGDAHQFGRVVDDLDHAPVADSNAPGVSVPSELFASDGPMHAPTDRCKKSDVIGDRRRLGGNDIVVYVVALGRAILSFLNLTRFSLFENCSDDR
jgi:hypothetical protein